MSHERDRGDNLLHELDSIRGLLDADDSAFRGESVELRPGPSDKFDASMEGALSEFHPDTEGEAMDSQNPPGRQEPTLDFGDEELPEEFLRDLDAPRFHDEPEEPTPDAASPRQFDAFGHREPGEAPSFGAPEPDIPVLTDSVDEPYAPPARDAHRFADTDGIPVLDDTVAPEESERGPTGYGAGLDVHSWEELEAIVDLLVDRRVDELRERLKEDLLAQLAHDTGLGPDRD